MNIANDVLALARKYGATSFVLYELWKTSDGSDEYQMLKDSEGAFERQLKSNQEIGVCSRTASGNHVFMADLDCKPTWEKIVGTRSFLHACPEQLQ